MRVNMGKEERDELEIYLSLASMMRIQGASSLKKESETCLAFIVESLF